MADGATGDFVATVGEVVGATLVVLDLTGTLSADSNVTTPTAGSMIGALAGGGFVGESWTLRIVNNSSASHMWTLNGGSGVTVVGTAGVNQGDWREWAMEVTGANAVSATNIGGGTA
jgi:hypothetical protein